MFDLTEPVTIIKPDAGERFQSMLLINQDHSMLPVEHGSGEFNYTQKDVVTRYVAVVLRTFVNSTDPADIKAANEIQDKTEVRQNSPGVFEIPDWDQASLKNIRDALLVLAADLPSFNGCFGDKSKIDPILFLLGAAAGWGGNPLEAAMSENVYPEKNDGKTPYSLTVKDVPVEGFWSITVYNAEGFMQQNDENAYSYNNINAERDEDGSITINFGAGPDAINNLPITPGWNYLVRLYQPKHEIRDGTWTFPRAKPIK